MNHRFFLEAEMKIEIAVEYDFSLGQYGVDLEIEAVHVLIDGAELPGYYDESNLPPALRVKIYDKIPLLTKDEIYSMAWADAE